VLSGLKGEGEKEIKKRAVGICRMRKRVYLCSPFRSGERGKKREAIFGRMNNKCSIQGKVSEELTVKKL
jgi:hypothetical protein